MFALLYLLTATDSYAHRSDYDHGMNLDGERTIVFGNGKIIKLYVYHQSGSDLSNYNPNSMLNNFEIYSNIYAEKHGLPSQDHSCRSDEVKVYYVKNSYLNDYSTIKYYGLPVLQKKSQRYLGIYSYRNYENIIMLSDSDYDRLSIGKRYIHEIAHLWYAKNCNFVASPDNEHEALDIEGLVRWLKMI